MSKTSSTSRETDALVLLLPAHLPAPPHQHHYHPIPFDAFDNTKIYNTINITTYTTSPTFASAYFPATVFLRHRRGRSLVRLARFHPLSVQVEVFARGFLVSHVRHFNTKPIPAPPLRKISQRTLGPRIFSYVPLKKTESKGE
jgi:hypothetical protein